MQVGTMFKCTTAELRGLRESNILELRNSEGAVVEGYELNPAQIAGAVSSSGYELQFIEIVDGIWHFRITAVP